MGRTKLWKTVVSLLRQQDSQPLHLGQRTLSVSSPILDPSTHSRHLFSSAIARSYFLGRGDTEGTATGHTERLLEVGDTLGTREEEERSVGDGELGGSGDGREGVNFHLEGLEL